MDLSKITYQEYKALNSEKMNALPMKFWFSKEQYKVALYEWGIEESEVSDKIFRFGQGHMLKTDEHLLNDWIKWTEESEKVLEQREDYLYQMYYYEFGNHESHVSGDYNNCLFQMGIELDTQLKKEAFNKAKEDHWKYVCDNDLF